MVYLIILFGILTFWSGTQFLLRPERTCSFLREKADSGLLHFLNAAVRIVFGITLLSLTSQSRFPLVTDIIGWFCIGIALVVTFMGHKRFIRIISWAIALLEGNNRIAGVLIMLFGAFLIFAFQQFLA